MSPAVRLTSPPAPAQLPEMALLNSNPTCADEEVVFCGIRTQARLRKTCPLTVAVAMYARLRSSLFGADAPITEAQLSSCLVPPANAVSLFVFCASSSPRKVQPRAVLLDIRVGAVPVQVVGSKLFQSIPAMAALSTRLPSSSSNPESVPTGPASAAIENTSRAETASPATVACRGRLLAHREARIRPP